MLLLDLTLDIPAENLALDEALLLAAESGELADEVLRLWEPRQFMVVLGSSSRMLNEVRLANVRQRRIEILRRSSGGAAVMAGPGCLMYALVLDRRRHYELHAIDTTHRFVLDRLVAALAPLAPGVSCKGTSDLVLAAENNTDTSCDPLSSPTAAEREAQVERPRKFSGNSLRMKRDWLLYHGTLLYGFPLALLTTCLGTPPRQPAYRDGRRHIEFVVNLPLSATALREAIAAAFDAREPLATWPRELTAQLAADKYSFEDWTYRL